MLNKYLAISLLLISANVFATGDPLIKGKCLDPDVAAEASLITKIHQNITVKLYHKWLDEGKGDATKLNSEELWWNASDAAWDITNTTYVCPSLPDQSNI